MKADEKYFWHRIKTEVGEYRKLPDGSMGKSPRDIINEDGFPLNYKRALYLLGKGLDRGWYDYGVTLDLGWMTPEGMEIDDTGWSTFAFFEDMKK